MISEPDSRPSWGLLKEDVVEVLSAKYWNNIKNLKSLLGGNIEFPLEVPLKPPTGNAALHNISHFQNFVACWKSFDKKRERKDNEVEVRWDTRIFRSLAEQEIPTHLLVPDLGALARLLGHVQEQQLRDWQSKIAYIFDSLSSELDKCIDRSSRATRERELLLALIAYLEALSGFGDSDLELLVKLIPQLQKGIGCGCYLRALSVTFVDTKFIEKNLRIIEEVTAAIIDSAAKEMGLLRWLDCRDKPKDWLLIKPLCKKAMDSLGGLPVLRMSSETLLDFELPANNVLVIENEQSCLSLDNISNTIAVSGGGKNVAWMKARWLANKRVGYWGDIDSEGLSILSDARSKLSTIIPVMMDSETVEAYRDRMVDEPESVFKEPIALTDDELTLFRMLRNRDYSHSRLEQERLPMDYVYKKIKLWIRSGAYSHKALTRTSGE